MVTGAASAGSGEEQQELARQAFDLARLNQGLLKGADLTAFVERSVAKMSEEK